MGSALVNFEHVLATVVFWKSFWLLHKKCLFLSDPDLIRDIKMQFVSNINLITAKKADPALRYVNLDTSL